MSILYPCVLTRLHELRIYWLVGRLLERRQLLPIMLTDPAAGRFSLRVPRQAFGAGDPAHWAYAAVLLSQDGFPSAGVWRVREAEASQWRLGGGPQDATYTRILDVAGPADAATTQESILSAYTPSSEPADSLPADSFAQLAMLRP